MFLLTFLGRLLYGEDYEKLSQQASKPKRRKTTRRKRQKIKPALHAGFFMPIIWDKSHIGECKMQLLITFDNGHVLEKKFDNATKAYIYANNNVALKNGKIKSIVLDTGQGLRNLWAAHWNSISKIEGMKLPC